MTSQQIIVTLTNYEAYYDCFFSNHRIIMLKKTHTHLSETIYLLQVRECVWLESHTHRHTSTREIPLH